MNNMDSNERYVGQIPVEELQRKFFGHYDYYFWIHKANSLLFFINNPENIKNMKAQEDIYDDQVILQALKMELHMSSFHSTESLFRQVFAIIYNPQLPWIWIARCHHTRLSTLIEKTKKGGLAALAVNPEEWLRANLYPTIDNKHKRYEKSKASASFVVHYLNSLAVEFIDHSEYNSYKHGLHCFPGIQNLTAINDVTSKVEFESENDVIEFLEFKKYQDEEGKCQKVSLTSKSYEYARDYNIIRMNSAIMYNLFYKKGMDVKLSSDPDGKKDVKLGYFYFNDRRLSDFFGSIEKEGKNSVTRFSR
jgi:hypothetical protein